MKKFYLFATLVVLISNVASAQYRLLLRNESFTPEKNISVAGVAELNRKKISLNRKSFVIIQFEGIPTESETRELKENGIQLLDYIPNNAYTATTTGTISASALQRVRARSVIELSARQKMQVSLANGNFPAHAVKVAGTLDVWVSFPKTFSFQEVSDELRNKSFSITSDLFKNYGVLELRIPVGRIGELALLPFVQYIQAAPKQDIPVNDHSTVNARANVLGSSVSGNRNLHGEGVVIGIGDNSDPLLHVDFTNRII
ncbi:MAG: peptidase S8/S53 subtilisin kexin sedolisin, partial [Dyadobacter sp.]